MNLNITPSRPRRVEEVDKPPQTRPKPVPFTWSRIKDDNKIEITICRNSRELCMKLVYHMVLFSEPVNKGRNKPDQDRKRQIWYWAFFKCQLGDFEQLCFVSRKYKRSHLELGKQ